LTSGKSNRYLIAEL